MIKRLAALTVAIALLVVPADAMAAPRQDIAAARKVLAAGYATLSAVMRTWPHMEASLRSLNRRFAAECPGVGAGSPQTEPEQRLSYEVAGALWATAYRADAGIVRKFIHETSGLSSTSPSLNRRMHKFRNGLQEMIALTVPDVCADVRAWTASGYRTIPADVLRFDRHVEAIDVAIPSPKLADPWVVPSDRKLVPKIEHLITRFEEREIATGQRYWNILLETLGLSQ